MKFTQIISYDLPDPDYFKDQLGWDVETTEDVVTILSDFSDEELRTTLGPITDYDCYAELEE